MLDINTIAVLIGLGFTSCTVLGSFIAWMRKSSAAEAREAERTRQEITQLKLRTEASDRAAALTSELVIEMREWVEELRRASAVQVEANKQTERRLTFLEKAEEDRRQKAHRGTT